MSTPHHPANRPRRLRRGQLLRDMVADVHLRPENLVLPIFVRSGEGIEQPIDSMSGVSQLSPDIAVHRMLEWSRDGLGAFILFGVIDADRKDATGSAALEADNPVHTTLRAARDAGVESLLIADLCLCEYTDHGHCGVIDEDERLTVDNDATLDLLARQAAMLAGNGADIIAPSGMIDGQVGAIRQALDAASLVHTAILSYSIKYASALYSPFRDAGEGAPQFGDRRGYQMDFRQSREWRTELQLDLEQGADMVMVKPALAYLDVLHQVRHACDVPVAAYHVSGEYAMLCAAADRGWVDLRSAAIELTTAIRRAGADMILTYLAPQLIRWL
jgi:porphobilinogen synthase